MTTIEKIKNQVIENKFLVLILLGAIFLRFFKLDYQSLWMDELYTMNVASSNHTFSQIISEVNQRESYPYLYFFMMNTLFTLFGDVSIVARIPSAIFGILAVFMIYKIGKELYSKNAGLIAAALLSFNQFAIYHSQEARAYTFYMFGLLISYYFFIKFLKENNKRNMLLYAIITGLFLNTNFFSALNVFSQGIFMLFILFSLEKSQRNAFFKKMLIIAGILLLFFIPNVYKFYLLTGLIATFIPKASDEALIGILKEIISGSIYLIFIYSILFTFFMIKVFSKKQTNKVKDILSNRLVFSYLIIFSWVVIVLAIIVVKSYTGSSIFLSRYFTSIVPGFILIIAISIVNIKNCHIRLSIVGLLLFFMSLELIVIKRYYWSPIKTQYREASQLIIDKNKTQETVYTSLKYWYDYFLNRNGVSFTVIEKPNIETVINEMMANPDDVKPFWFTDAHGRPYQLSEQAQNFVNNNYYIDYNYDGLDAWTKHFILLKDVDFNVDISKYGELKEINGEKFNHYIEVYEDNGDILNISGWAYFENVDSKNSKIELVLIKDSKATILPSQSVNRSDVTSYFKSAFDLSNSGFKVNYRFKDLPAGNYDLGLLIENQSTKKSGLIITDKKISVNK